MMDCPKHLLELRPSSDVVFQSRAPNLLQRRWNNRIFSLALVSDSAHEQCDV